ncbi:peptide release factor [Schizosaccharomyces japonicus yFS275]|uniref:Peptide release factor n=1 Tax=Schizosaccharomyces japonicus (strain yFS275 / FY16936) TaxID=402676 RepID=B6JVA1_SCHJY|nr:peptide release factor [Schizosaccharomyces japonicus yFS275]EEB05302.1 peptide release factor [Schizosaccharomyces japonicus yFS275]
MKRLFGWRLFESMAFIARRQSFVYPAFIQQRFYHLVEADLDETFIRGHGPGGQKINKTSIVCQLRHKPSGLIVRCQETRSREQNRKIARKRLAEKLDLLANGEKSRLAQDRQRILRRKRQHAKRSREKYSLTTDEDDGNKIPTE